MSAIHPSRAKSWSWPWMYFLWLGMISLPGCGGCQADLSQVEREEKDPSQPREIKKPKPDFDVLPVKVLPYDITLVVEQEEQNKAEAEKEKSAEPTGAAPGTAGSGVFAYAKPSHWSTASQPVRANNFDFRGELILETTHTLPGAGRRTSVGLESAPFRLESWRNAILPKTQFKYLDVNFFLPAHARPMSTGLDVRLSSRGGGAIGGGVAQTSFVRFLRPQEFFFVVLSANRDRYSYVGLLPTSMPPGEEYEILQQYRQPTDYRRNPNSAPLAEDESTLSGDIDLNKYPLYRVVRPEISEKLPIPLPSSALTWTSIACLLWDDIRPDQLADEQRTALLDWLHWGGQIIISGPDSLASLRGSFLDQYLPARAGDSVELDEASLAHFNRDWLPPGSAEAADRLPVTKSWLGIRLQEFEGQGPTETLVATATEPNMPLVIERRVGRGRIVATSFRLTEHDLITWRHVDGFFNGCLLRRPPRAHRDDQSIYLHVLTWSKEPQRQFDGRLVSRMRYFSRDVADPDSISNELAEQAANSTVELRTGIENRNQVFSSIPYRGNFETNATTGLPNPPRDVASWSDFNPVGEAARKILREAAGIEIPRASFVLLVLFFYLMVLVPINYAIFFLVRRLEWAWIAVPLIAIGGAGVVIKMAQLDIGFVRSKTEVGVMEVHAGYPRAHMTRYTALYTSLSSDYTVEFDRPGALALPLSADQNFTPKLGQELTRVRYLSETDTRMTGFPVISNSTSMVHGEQMIDLEGALILKPMTSFGGEIVNGMKYKLRDVMLLERPAQGAGRVAWIGDLAPPLAKSYKWQNLQPGQRPRDVATVDPAAQTDNEVLGKSLNLDPLRNLAEDMEQLEPGETRLVARIDGPVQGESIQPVAPQVLESTLLVMYFKHGDLPMPAPDVNYLPYKATADEDLYLK